MTDHWVPEPGTPTITPSEAAELQFELARHWAGTEGARFMRGWLHARSEAGIHVHFSGDVRRSIEHSTMMRARTYWVSDDMLMLADHASRSMPEQALLLTDLPVRTGFVVFQHPMAIQDVRGKFCSVAAFAWTVLPTADNPDAALQVTLYSDTCDRRDEYRVTVMPTYPVRLLLLSENTFMFGETLSPDKFMPDHREGVSTVTPDRAGMTAWGLPQQESFRTFVTLPKTLWTLMQQRLALTDEVAVDRATRRRIERAGGNLADKRIITVKLRLPKPVAGEGDQDAEHHAVQWTHRWIVSGHWRNQWFPSIQQHRTQWIAGYQKGPPDKPLVLRRRVFKLER